MRPEILALSEIPFVKAFTARLLYRAGLRWGVVLDAGAGLGWADGQGSGCAWGPLLRSAVAWLWLASLARSRTAPRAMPHSAWFCRTPEAVAAVENVEQIVSILASSQQNP